MAKTPAAIMPKDARILNRFSDLDFIVKKLGKYNIQKFFIFFFIMLFLKQEKIIFALILKE